MPYLTFPKSPLGAIVDVSLLPSSRKAAVRAGSPTLQAATFRMLIDSGADRTGVDASIIAPWGLRRSSFYLSGGINGGPPSQVDVYDLSLSIMGMGGAGLFYKFDPQPIGERKGSPFNGLPFDGVIGRDVLDKGLFVYDGYHSHCVLAF
jgi:hypothetical protein